MPDPEAMRRRLLEAGASPGFRGLMIDRRFDRDARLLQRDEVLRVREYRGDNGESSYGLSWKGPTGTTREGYKSRTELEYDLVPHGAAPDALLEALGYEESQRIERYVEYYRVLGADLRLEWYPRMDVLIELEGEPSAIETVLPLTGLPREQWYPDPLPVFAARFAARTGTAAILTRNGLTGSPPSWEQR